MNSRIRRAGARQREELATGLAALAQRLGPDAGSPVLEMRDAILSPTAAAPPNLDTDGEGEESAAALATAASGATVAGCSSGGSGSGGRGGGSSGADGSGGYEFNRKLLFKLLVMANTQVHIQSYIDIDIEIYICIYI